LAKSNLYIEAELAGMTRVPVGLEQLQETLPKLVGLIHSMMTDGDRRFLLSLKGGAPDWQDFALPDTARLPAVQWKLANIRRMSKSKHAAAVEKLNHVLFG
jgi:hypothetical protein